MKTLNFIHLDSIAAGKVVDSFATMIADYCFFIQT